MTGKGGPVPSTLAGTALSALILLQELTHVSATTAQENQV